MNIASLFTAAGLKAAWAKLMVASLAVKVGAAVIAVASTALILYGVYKFYKFVTKPKRRVLEGESQRPNTEQVAELTSSKIGFGQRVKNWLNPSRIIGYVDSTVNRLHLEFTSKVEEQNIKLEKLQPKSVAISDKKNFETQLAALKTSVEADINKKTTEINNQANAKLTTLDQKVAALEALLRQTNTGLTTKLGGLESEIKEVSASAKKTEEQVGSFAHLSDVAQEMQFAASDFIKKTSRISYRPRRAEAANAEAVNEDAGSEISEMSLVEGVAPPSLAAPVAAVPVAVAAPAPTQTPQVPASESEAEKSQKRPSKSA